MGDVHDHTEPVHLANDLLAEFRQTVMRRLIRGGIGPIGITEVRQCHGTDAEPVICAQYGKVVVNGMAAFNGKDRRNFARARDAFHIGCRQRQFHLAALRVQHALQGVAQLQGTANRLGAVIVRGHP